MSENKVEELSDPGWWFDSIVKPNYDEYCSDPLSRRKAVNAIVTTYHFWERLYHFQKQRTPDALANFNKDQKYRDWLIKHRPNLGVLRDVADAVKHQLRERKASKPSPLDSTAKGITPLEISLTATGVTSNLARSSSGVTMTPSNRRIEELVINGTNMSVKELLEDVIEF